MSSPSFFFPGSSSTTHDKKDVKPIENPLLINQKQQGFATPTAASRQSPSAGILTTLSPNNINNDSMLGLRNRKAAGGPHIPKASYSVGGGLIGTTTATTTTTTAAASTSSYQYDRPSHYQPSATSYHPTSQNTQQRDYRLVEPQSTMMMTSTIETTPRHLLLPHTTNCWVLVYGFATNSQYNQVVQKFSSFGHVLAIKGTFHPGRSNWIALQYSSQLEAEKAVCHNHMKLATDGDDTSFVFCGVKRLQDNDPILVQASQQDLMGLWKNAKTVGEEPHLMDDTHRGSALSQQMDRASDMPLEEKDILLYTVSAKENRVAVPSEQSVCEKFARWLFSIR